MLPASLSSAEFYLRRDNRTNSCPGAAGYESTRILVTVGHSVANSASGQLAALGLCNQLARWCRVVAVEIPSMPTLLPTLASPEFSSALLEVMAGADPFGAFTVSPDEARPADVHVHIGTGRVLARAGKFIQTSYSGWFAAATTETEGCLPEPLGNRNDFPGAAVASCLACARAFQLAVSGDQQSVRTIAFDLWSLSPTRTVPPALWRDKVTLAVGTILMVGAGSVGSGAAYWMRFFDLEGRMDTVDHDLTKIENLNRGLPFTVGNLGQNKAQLVADLFPGGTLEVVPFEMDWNGYVAAVGRTKMPRDLWLPLANERNVRASMQENLPPLMIHASTARNWGANFGRHIPFRDDCIIDRFPLESNQPVLRCSSSPIKVADDEVDAALPFLSAFAGLLVAADVVRSTAADFPQTPNFGSFDFHSGLAVQSWDRKPSDSCSCRNLSRDLWRTFNPHGRRRTVSGHSQPEVSDLIDAAP